MKELWVMDRADDLLWMRWEQDYSVFDRGTGMTHLLNELPAEMIRVLSAGPLTAVELAEHLALDCDRENDSSWRERVEDILSQLAAIGLLEAGEACA